MVSILLFSFSHLFQNKIKTYIKFTPKFDGVPLVVILNLFLDSHTDMSVWSIYDIESRSGDIISFIVFSSFSVGEDQRVMYIFDKCDHMFRYRNTEFFFMDGIKFL